MDKCLLCDGSITQSPKIDIYEVITCRGCGKYKISTLDIIKLGDGKLEKIRHLLASEVYLYNQNNSETLLIDFDLIDRITNSDKDFFQHKVLTLALHCYKITKLNYTGYKIDDINPRSCYAKNKEEFNSIIKHLKVLGILDFQNIENNFLSKNISMIINIEMTTSAFMLFEQEKITTIKQLKEAFMEEERKLHTNIINSFNNNENSNITQNSTGDQTISQDLITIEFLIKGLLENNVKYGDIEKILDELKELSNELNNKNLNKTKLTSIFKNIYLKGGKYILPAFTFLTRPEVIALIDKLKDLHQ